MRMAVVVPAMSYEQNKVRNSDERRIHNPPPNPAGASGERLDH